MGGNMNEWMGEFVNDWVSEIVHGEEWEERRLDGW